MTRRWSLRGRFPVFVAGAAVASLVWLLVVTLTALTPGEARERRAAPELPIPSVPVERTELRQVSWTECSSTTTSVPIVVYGAPAGRRPVVTQVAAFGTKAATGKVLATIAGRPVVAVATDLPLYRDLTVGTRGPDVRAFEEALAAAGLVGSADDVLDAGALAAWRELVPGTDRVVVDTIAQVPPGARVEEARVQVGDVVAAGDILMQVAASADYYACPGLPPGVDLAAGKVLLEVGGRQVEVDRLVRTDQEGNEIPGEQGAGDEARDEDGGRAADPGVLRVRPEGGVETGADGASARLGVVSADSGGPVLAVPVTAIKTDADGQSVVVVVEGRSRTKVAVTLGASAQGLVEVEGSGVAEGDRVEVFGATVAGAGE